MLKTLIRKAMERLTSMSKWGKTFVDDALYAAYLRSKRAYMDAEIEPSRYLDNTGPRISKTVYPDGKTIIHIKTKIK